MINIEDLFKGLQESGFGRGGFNKGGNVPGGGIGVGYMPLPSDPTFSSGNSYAQSIAGGQNVQNMIAPGMSFSAANPQGYTQEDVRVRSPGGPGAGYIPGGSKYRGGRDDYISIGGPGGNDGMGDSIVYKGGSKDFDERGSTFNPGAGPKQPKPVGLQDFGFGPGIIPSEITTADGQFIGSGGVTPGGYQGFDFSGLQKVLDNLPAQKVDANDYKDDIMKIVNENFTIPTFDPSFLQNQIDANKGSIGNIPTFDDSELRELIAGNTTGINSIPDFDPSTLNLPDFNKFATIDDLENRPIYDDTDIRNKITSIENQPDFDINDYKDNITSIARQGIDIPQFDDSAIRDMINNNFNMISNIPQFDPSSINNQISGLQDQILDIPQFDASGLQSQIGNLQDQIGNIPQFDPSTLNLPDFSNFATRSDLENRPIYDDTAIRDQITSIEQRPTFDPTDLQSQISGLQDQFSNIPQFDASGLQNQIANLQGQIGNIPTYQAPDLSGFMTQEDINKAISNIQMPKAPNIDDLLARLDALENAKSPVLPPVIDDTSKKVTPIKTVGAV